MLNKLLKTGLLIFVLFNFIIFAEDNLSVDELVGLSLEELLNVELTVASKKATTIRETPGIVSVINKDDIIKYGCRDLIDILQLLVPGFTFGGDVEGAVGLSLRGLWGHEGKILLMIDGQECNEGMFGVTVFGNHYTVDNIEKIEIIRGPGSAIYGGYAGLGVINIITKGADMKGGYISLLNSQIGATPSHRNTSFGYGNKINDFGFSFTGTYGFGNRSEQDNIDYFGNKLSMKNRSKLDIYNLNINLNYKGIDFRYIIDLYRTTQIDLWGENYMGRPLNENFDSYFLQLKYDYKPIENLILTPKIKFKRQYPWQLNVEDQDYSNNKKFEKLEIGFSGLYDFNKNINVVFGAEYYNDKLIMPDYVGEFEEIFSGDSTKKELSYHSYALYAQGMIFTDYANITAGMRYDESNEFGKAYVPRIGLTKAFSNLHFKLMLSQSFRTPGGILPNRLPAGADKIKPEEAVNYEMELGYRLTKDSWLVVNGYKVNFEKVIVYGTTPSGIGTYVNAGKIGSYGLEAEYKYLGKKMDFSINYAFYNKDKKTSASSYEVPGNDNLFLGFPAHRINAMFSYKILDNLSINLSNSFFGERYRMVDTGTGSIPKKISSTNLFNINLHAVNVFTKGLNLDFGIHNILGEEFSYIQPYDGAHAPIPGQDRSYMAKISYNF